MNVVGMDAHLLKQHGKNGLILLKLELVKNMK